MFFNRRFSSRSDESFHTCTNRTWVSVLKPHVSSRYLVSRFGSGICGWVTHPKVVILPELQMSVFLHRTDLGQLSRAKREQSVRPLDNLSSGKPPQNKLCGKQNAIDCSVWRAHVAVCFSSARNGGRESAILNDKFKIQKSEPRFAWNTKQKSQRLTWHVTHLKFVSISLIFAPRRW